MNNMLSKRDFVQPAEGLVLEPILKLKIIILTNLFN